ncbi:MAG TPA: helix-hairpin-helix domain-containing protein [Chitinophagaceae bacterium]|nr:helix-hairpin-helix domain-containing protein [Chitinophagaceae bacterium]
MGWKQIAADYFSFTSKDRIAVITLAVLIVIIVLLPGFVTNNNGRQRKVQTDTTWVVAARQLELNNVNGPEEDDEPVQRHQFDRQYRASIRPAASLFYFDPNTLDEAGWRKLGLRDKTIHTILNYVSKGGRFRKPEDLSKIYGLFKDEYARLEPYIRIEQTITENRLSPVEPALPKQPKLYAMVDINTADTSAFIALPGIGSKLALRIVNFREKLGGFYRVEQVGETFGLADSVFQKIKPRLQLNPIETKKININTASIDELKQHPYIRFALAKAIIAYRDAHGEFAQKEDLKKIMLITEDVFRKIDPYITLQ